MHSVIKDGSFPPLNMILPLLSFNAFDAWVGAFGLCLLLQRGGAGAEEWFVIQDFMLQLLRSPKEGIGIKETYSCLLDGNEQLIPRAMAVPPQAEAIHWKKELVCQAG